MGRWMPGAESRLVDAALDLYAEHGYDRTTVAEIADRAGVTERTFFRYFSDKREVLFAGSHLEQRMAEGIRAADPDASPLDAAVEGLAAAVEILDHPFARRRNAVVSAHPALQERELLKLAGMATAAARALEERGVDPRAAALAGESAVAIFKTAFVEWVGADVPDDLPAIMRSVLAQLRETVAG